MVLVTKKKRSTPIHHKRRLGEHHSRDDRYHKAYWPYLPMALIVGVGMLANAFWGTIQQNVLSYATNTSISSLLQETNEERIAGSLEGLTLNAKLNQAAQAKANDMATRNYWSHNTPDGNAPWTFFTNAGYEFQSAGENLAYGFANSTDTLTGWMNSPGHKANILNTTYKEVGFGIANAENYQGNGPETIVVALYGSPYGTPINSAVAQTPAPASEEKPVQIETNATLSPATESNNNNPATASGAVAPQDVARIQLLSGGAGQWSVFAVSALVTICIVIFFLRHGVLWHRVLVKSEAFVHKHPLLDLALVTIATLGFLLTRTDGIIR